jgi:hypothetical protein
MARKKKIEVWESNSGDEFHTELRALVEDFLSVSDNPEELTVQGSLKPTHEFTEAVEALHEYVHRGVK